MDSICQSAPLALKYSSRLPHSHHSTATELSMNDTTDLARAEAARNRAEAFLIKEGNTAYTVTLIGNTADGYRIRVGFVSLDDRLASGLPPEIDGFPVSSGIRPGIRPL